MDASTEVLLPYICIGLEHVGKSGGDDNEIIEVIEVPIRSVQEYLAESQSEGVLGDLKVFGLVELARRHLGLGFIFSFSFSIPQFSPSV